MPLNARSFFFYFVVKEFRRKLFPKIVPSKMRPVFREKWLLSIHMAPQKTRRFVKTGLFPKKWLRQTKVRSHQGENETTFFSGHLSRLFFRGAPYFREVRAAFDGQGPKDSLEFARALSGFGAGARAAAQWANKLGAPNESGRVLQNSVGAAG